MRFKIAGNFEADSIDDAFVRLARHFLLLTRANDDSTYTTGGYSLLGDEHTMLIEPCLDTDESLP